MDSVSAIALSISSRLISRGKEKALMNMTSGIDMLALALTISREVWIFLISSVILIYSSVKNNGVFPDNQADFKECLI